MDLRYREFDTPGDLEDEAYALLHHALMSPLGKRALMLTGGSTPFGIYAALQASCETSDPGVTVFLSDDRYVSLDSSSSNTGRLQPMLKALEVKSLMPPANDGTSGVSRAAEQYSQSLDTILGDVAPLAFPLGVLGLGADGHVAGLFNDAHLSTAAERSAIAVERPDGMQGITVTPDVLCRAERIVFWVTGPEKRDAVEALRHYPETVVAGRALANAGLVELWFSPSA